MEIEWNVCYLSLSDTIICALQYNHHHGLFVFANWKSYVVKVIPTAIQLKIEGHKSGQWGLLALCVYFSGRIHHVDVQERENQQIQAKNWPLKSLLQLLSLDMLHWKYLEHLLCNKQNRPQLTAQAILCVVLYLDAPRNIWLLWAS